MSIIKVLLGAFTGTSLMTSFSYLLANKLNRQYKEPVLLNKLISGAEKINKKSDSPLPGWLIHYSIGLIFVSGYHFIWKKFDEKPNMLNGTVLGLLSGAAGTAGWATFLNKKSNPPTFDRAGFYLHLLLVHILFGWGAVTGYKTPELEALK